MSSESHDTCAWLCFLALAVAILECGRTALDSDKPQQLIPLAVAGVMGFVAFLADFAPS